MAEFIEKNDFKGRRVALFGTTEGGTGIEVKTMEEALEEEGAEVLGSYFCKIQAIGLFSRDHPDSDEIDAARTFARETAGLPSLRHPVSR